MITEPSSAGTVIRGPIGSLPIEQNEQQLLLLGTTCYELKPDESLVWAHAMDGSKAILALNTPHGTELLVVERVYDTRERISSWAPKRRFVGLTEISKPQPSGNSLNVHLVYRDGRSGTQLFGPSAHVDAWLGPAKPRSPRTDYRALQTVN